MKRSLTVMLIVLLTGFFTGVADADDLAGPNKMRFAEKASDRGVFMADGFGVEDAAPHEIFSSPKHDRTQAFLHEVLK